MDKRNKKRMKLIVVDDHPLVRQGIEMVTSLEEDIEVVGFAANGREAAALLEESRPDIALVDLRMPGEHGLEIVKKGRDISPVCKFIILTSYVTEEEIREAMISEVDGYILKDALPEELLSAIRLVFGGKKYFDPAVVQYAMGSRDTEETDTLSQLTTRELEVLTALAKGMNNRSISEALFISEHTVKKHIGQILEKLELQDRTQAALFAVSKGLNKKE